MPNFGGTAGSILKFFSKTETLPRTIDISKDQPASRCVMCNKFTPSSPTPMHRNASLRIPANRCCILVSLMWYLCCFYLVCHPLGPTWELELWETKLASHAIVAKPIAMVVRIVHLAKPGFGPMASTGPADGILQQQRRALACDNPQEFIQVAAEACINAGYTSFAYLVLGDLDPAQILAPQPTAGALSLRDCLHKVRCQILLRMRPQFLDQLMA